MKEEHVWIIYSHMHVASGRRYVGLTKKTMLFRWNQHVRNAKQKPGKGCSYFWAAIRKYGKDAFEHKVLGTYATLGGANAAEQEWIEKLGTRDPEKGFNLMRGGIHTPSPDGVLTRERLSAASKRAATPERRAFLSSIRIGRPLSEETRAKISASAKKHSEQISSRNKLRGHDYFVRIAKMMSQETRSKTADLNRGRSPSPEERAKISAAGVGRHHSEITKARLSLKSRNPSDATKAKLSLAGKKGCLLVARGPNGKFM